jgi:hypothetical protein
VPRRDDIVPFTGGSIRAPLEAFTAELPIEAVGLPGVAVVVCAKLDDVPSSIAVPASAATRQVLKSHTLVLRMIRLPL